MSRIARVEAWTVRLPMARPLVIAKKRLDERAYVVVRVTTDDGVEGAAAGLNRGHPTQADVEALAPSLAGRELDELRLEGPPRAVSLVDCALWDARARTAGLPLRRLLGEELRPLPAIVYGGFDDDVEGELGAYAAAGAPAVKLARLPASPEEEAARLARARAALGDGGLVLDAGWSFADPAEAQRYARAYEPHGLLWLEDPFPPHSGPLLAELRRLIAQPLGAGDEWTDEAGYAGAVEALDVVRIDATTAGGVTGFLRIARLARAAGKIVSAHMHDYVHVHLPVDWVERAVDTATIDPLDRVFRTRALDGGGTLTAPDEPGLGIEVDWEAIAR